MSVHVPLQLTWLVGQHKPALQLPEQQSLFCAQVEPFWWQVETQVPLVQVCPVAQACPQAPQLLVSLLRSLQAPAQQAGVVPMQTWPQVPQFFGLVFRLTQVPLQLV